jgi:hypothetical protein
MTIHNQEKTFALVSEFNRPHPELLERSFQTVFTCRHHGNKSLRLIKVSTIQSVVAMVPHQFPGIDGTLFCLIEHPGLDLLTMGGAEEHIADEE